ncbi:hypothetical protein, partial [Roseibium sp.]|uniref:hypothetical protein n=1 Tax=Roseibium sp. TaxID=1936156 RepID=UPI003A98301A
PKPRNKHPRNGNMRVKDQTLKRRQSPQNLIQNNKPAEIDGFVSGLKGAVGRPLSYLARLRA